MARSCAAVRRLLHAMAYPVQINREPFALQGDLSTSPADAHRFEHVHPSRTVLPNLPGDGEAHLPTFGVRLHAPKACRASFDEQVARMPDIARFVGLVRAHKDPVLEPLVDELAGAVRFMQDLLLTGAKGSPAALAALMFSTYTPRAYDNAVTKAAERVADAVLAERSLASKPWADLDAAIGRQTNLHTFSRDTLDAAADMLSECSSLPALADDPAQWTMEMGAAILPNFRHNVHYAAKALITDHRSDMYA